MPHTFYDCMLQADTAFKTHSTYSHRSPGFCSTSPRFAEMKAANVDFYVPTNGDISNNTKTSHNSAFRSRSPRMGHLRSKSSPGIGTYDPKQPAWGKDGPSPMAHSKVERFRNRTPPLPAPGSYDPAVDKKGRSTVERKAARMDTLGPRFKSPNKDAPPPGTYDAVVDKKGQATFSRHGGMVRTSSPRFRPRPSITPAPGAYDAVTRGDAKGPRLDTTTPRFKARPNTNPAPGDYNYNTSAFLKQSYITGRAHS